MISGMWGLFGVEGLATELVAGPVDYGVLRPDDSAVGLPLILFLHGGGGTHELLAAMQPIFEEAWTAGVLPPAVVASPSAGRSFYLDNPDRTERWETFIVQELIPHISAAYSTVGHPHLCGMSMGGLGALRMAFRDPGAFGAVAALEPAIEATAEWLDVLIRDRIYRPPALLRRLYGDPIDVDHFRTNHPLWLARTNAPAIAASGLPIYIECGDEDVLRLHMGAEVLHRCLFERGISHEFRLVRGPITSATRCPDASWMRCRSSGGRCPPTPLPTPSTPPCETAWRGR